MKKYSILNFQLTASRALPFSILNCLFCLILCGCITEYEATGIDEIADILVVEGIITDDETTITLSRSMNLSGGFLKYSSSSYYPYPSYNYVDNARVYIECDDGTQWEAETFDGWWVARNGKYTIKTGTLHQDRKYCLKIEIEENDGDCIPDGSWGWSCPTKIYEYCSEFSYPIRTPEIDSIFWIKRGRGQPVMIHVATNSQDNKVLYYRWSYNEDWEIISDVYLENYPYYCWNTAKSNEILLGSAEKTIFGKLTDKVTEISPSNRKLSVLYRIDVKQNAISKRAYDYFANIKKNSQQSGSIFAPTPSELRGNITCTTDPGRPVIGYIDISSTTHKRRYIAQQDNVYERPHSNCDTISKASLCEERGLEGRDCFEFDPLEYGYVIYEYSDQILYMEAKCVDCTLNGGTLQKPDDWPR